VFGPSDRGFELPENLFNGFPSPDRWFEAFQLADHPLCFRKENFLDDFRCFARADRGILVFRVLLFYGPFEGRRLTFPCRFADVIGAAQVFSFSSGDQDFACRAAAPRGRCHQNEHWHQ
jgi:hypothetical protein